MRAERLIVGGALVSALIGCSGGSGDELPSDLDTAEPGQVPESKLEIAAPSSVRVRVGSSVDFAVSVSRQEQIDGPIRVWALSRPDGTQVAEAVIDTGADEAVMSIEAMESAPHAGPVPLVLVATSVDDADVSGSVQLDAYVAGPYGSLDESFGEAGMVSLPGRGEDKRWQLGPADLDPAGGLIAGGRESDYSDNSERGLIVRLNSDGSLDSDFGDDGWIFGLGVQKSSTVADLVVDDSGAIIAIASIRHEKLELRRYFQDGTRDLAYGASELSKFLTPFPRVFSMAGGVLVRGHEFLTAYDDSGNPESSFGADASEWSAGSARSDSNGRILLGMSSPEGEAVIGRLNPDGSLDETFGTDGIAVWPSEFEGREISIHDVAPDPGGGGCGVGIVKGHYGVSEDQCIIVRFDAGGELVEAFGEDGMVTFESTDCRAVHLEPDGSVFVSRLLALERFTPDGSPDEDFGEGGTLALPMALARFVFDPVAKRLIVTGSLSGAFFVRLWL